MDRKLLKKTVKTFILVSFVTFMALFLSQNTGYIEYQNRRQVELTTNQIKRFEKDVKEGKNIDLKDYLKTNNYNYQNKLSKIGLKISNITKECVSITVKKSFKILSKLVE